MGAQALHKKNSTKNAGNQHQRSRRENSVEQCHIMHRFLTSMAQLNPALILAQHLQPGTDVVGVAHGRHDTERGTDEGTRYFGDQLFACVRF
jgi:hypothetical protein